MTKDQIDEFELALFEFVKRASSKEATAEEVEALPAVADTLMRLLVPQRCSNPWVFIAKSFV